MGRTALTPARSTGLRRLAALTALLAPVACATIQEPAERIDLFDADPAYDSLFPYYVELCAVSQIRARFTGHGGSPGHAAMYYRYIEAQLADTEAKILQLRELGAATDDRGGG